MTQLKEGLFSFCYLQGGVGRGAERGGREGLQAKIGVL